MPRGDRRSVSSTPSHCCSSRERPLAAEPCLRGSLSRRELLWNLGGGLGGIALGWLIGKAINFGTGIYLKQQELPPETVLISPWWLLLGAILFAVAVSLIAGLYPAARAAKLDPVQALRYE